MLWERKLARWLAEMREKADIPARLVLWNGRQYDLGRFISPRVILTLTSAKALRYLFKPTLDKLGEAYVQGQIDIHGELTDLIGTGYLLASGAPASKNIFARARRALARACAHTRASDSKAIRYHYDVSNTFYQLWLDENMVYSCAYFENGNEDIDTAQLKKIDHILTKLQLQPGHTLLDIGCGWGTLVLRAAQKFGARCVGVTLSQDQFDLANARVRAAGLENRIEIRLQDYRDIEVRAGDQFDRITSVGMFEHVGEKNLPLYFEKIRALLKDDGMAMNHGITSAICSDSQRTLGGGRFIKKYVFPDGELPHLSTALEAMRRGGLEALDIENLRRHYARTLTLWAQRLEHCADEAKKLIEPKKFRIWRVYLAGCAYAFEHDYVSVYQIVCCKTGRHARTLPWSRRYMYEAV